MALAHRHQNLLRVGILESALERPCDGTPHGGEHDHIIGAFLEHFPYFSSQHGVWQVFRGRERRWRGLKRENEEK